MDQGLCNEDIEAEEVELEELLKEETEEREPSTGDIKEETDGKEASTEDIQEETEGNEPSADDHSASREGDSYYGSIKSLGFVQKVINKTFFCMKPRARIGVFFLLTMIQEVVGLISGISTIWMMMRTGFAVEGSLLLLVQECGSNISN